MANGLVLPTHHLGVDDTNGRVSSGYTPVDHALTPNASLQRTLERFDGDFFKTHSAVHEFDIFTRHFPVEQGFFSNRGPPCVSNAYQLPPPSYRYRAGTKCAPKFACGPARAFALLPQCVIWSIGSAGETCFEEHVHDHAPACQIHVFDPTLPEKAVQHLRELEAAHVLQLHEVCMHVHEQWRNLRNHIDRHRHTTFRARR